MKATTMIWAKFESKGRPALTEIHNASTQEILQKLIRWTLRAYMGQYIRITFARRESELNLATSQTTGMVDSEADLFAELAALTGLNELPLEEDQEPELFEAGESEDSEG